jgi:hypothetical protein
VAGALQADELGYIFEILSEHISVATRHDRHVTDAIRQQFFTAADVVQNVNGDEVDIFFRKKLFRFEARTSPRLGEQQELVGDGVHDCDPL